VKSPEILKVIPVEAITVSRGQALTVWLDGAQVELRVHENGIREVFWEGDVRQYSFVLWSPNPLSETPPQDGGAGDEL
jgi:hypothetical protein